jgi:hypothetical protein
MPSKKQLQEQIDELRSKIEGIYTYSIDDANDGLVDFRLLEMGECIGSEVKNGFVIKKQKAMVNIKELRKQFLALLDYLKIEYEDKHLEGFKNIK